MKKMCSQDTQQDSPKESYWLKNLFVQSGWGYECVDISVFLKWKRGGKDH